MSSRTEYSQTFANPDGTWSSETTTEPQFVQQPDGSWQDIDTTLRWRDGRLEPRASLADLSLSDGGDSTFADISRAGNDVDWKWPTQLPAPTIDGSTATYADVVPGGGDLVVTATATGFTHDIVLDAPPAAAVNDPSGQVSYTVPVATHGADLTTSHGGFAVSDDGDRLVTAPAPLAYDGAGDQADPLEGAAVEPVAVATGQNAAGTPTMTLKVDSGFLTDPSTVYPVTIDPTFSITPQSDTYADNSNPNGNYSTYTYLRVGDNAGASVQRAFFHFAFTGHPYSGTDIISASLKLQNINANSCAAGAIYATRITSDWYANTLTWNNQPTVDTTGATSFSPAYGYSSSCPDNYATWDVTPIMAYWAAHPGTNYGIRVKAGDETDPHTWRSYRSMESTAGSATIPKLTVNYDSYPNTPSGLSASPGNTGYTTSLTPTVSAVVSDPDKGSVKADFEIKNGAGSVVWSGSTGSVGSGGRASISVPAGKLTEGSTYTLRAWADDSVAPKSQTAAGPLTFKVDTTAPTVGVSSNKFTDQNWTATMPSSSTFTYTGSSDTASFQAQLDDNQPWTVAASNGSGTTSWTPAVGWHVLTVTPTDKAGNRGATVTYSFGTGAAAADSPSENARSTDSFPVAFSGPPGADSASMQWRLLGGAAWQDATQTKVDGTDWDGTLINSDTSHSATPRLIWKATDESIGADKLSSPAVVEIRGCFHYTGSPDNCTPARVLQLVPSAFDDTYPVVSMGPASVALFTGEAAIGGTDATGSVVGLGRSFTSYDASTLNTGRFGPGWSDPTFLTPTSDSALQVIDNRSKDGSFILTASGGGSQTFVPTTSPYSVDTTAWIPLDPTGDATSLTLTRDTNKQPVSLELDRPLGTGLDKIHWTYETSVNGGAPGWVFASSDQPGTASDFTADSTNQRPTWISESEPGASTSCTAARQAVGCHGLAITYTGSGSTTRVASATRVIGADTQAEVSTKTLAAYGYDTNGVLTSVCSASPGGVAPPLCTGYTYTTVNSRTLLATITPAGQTPGDSVTTPPGAS